jgi:hypothetical protein
MASENNRRLQRLFAPVLKERGFRKLGATWRKVSSEAVAVFNVQRSLYGQQFYINLGVYFSRYRHSPTAPRLSVPRSDAA